MTTQLLHGWGLCLVSSPTRGKEDLCVVLLNTCGVINRNASDLMPGLTGVSRPATVELLCSLLSMLLFYMMYYILIFECTKF